MQELIKVTTDGQGSSVVSARELYAFLEVKAKFQDWIKRRIIKYGFLKDRDYVELEGVFLKSEKNLSDPDTDEVLFKSEYNPVGGRPMTDYVLTLGMAKELAMVEGNAKGKEARLYFIEREELARKLLEQQPAAPVAVQSATDQIVLQIIAQQSQLITGLINQQDQLTKLQAGVDAIMAGRKPARIKPTPQLPATHVSMDSTVLRRMIANRVNEYCGYYGETQSDTYRFLYKRLQEGFGISVYNIPRIGKESYLDVLERSGHLNRLYSVVTSLLVYPEE